MKKKTIGWGWIIFWLIVFSPVGMFMLISKVANDKSVLISGKTRAISTVAWFFIIIGVLGMLTNSKENPALTNVMFLAVTILGIWLLRKRSKLKKTINLYKKYMDMVSNQHIRNIDNISSAVGLTYDTVAKDLQEMINIGYLQDAYINQGTREIILNRQERVVYVRVPAAGVAEQAEPQTKTVRCQGCGANNVVVVGKVSECEYCGTPINA